MRVCHGPVRLFEVTRFVRFYCWLRFVFDGQDGFQQLVSLLFALSVNVELFVSVQKANEIV